MKNCITFLITSTSVIAKTIIVERLKSYLHFQLKLLSFSIFLHASIIKNSREHSVRHILRYAFLNDIVTSLTFARSFQHSIYLFEIVAVVYDLLMRHKTYAKVLSLSCQLFLFLFNTFKKAWYTL